MSECREEATTVYRKDPVLRLFCTCGAYWARVIWSPRVAAIMKGQWRRAHRGPGHARCPRRVWAAVHARRVALNRVPMMKPQDAKVLQAIQSFTTRYGYPPTVRDLAAAMGMKSTSHVDWHLMTLERLGLITWEAGIARTTRVVGNG